MCEWLFGGSLPTFRSTSRQLSAVRPQFAYSSPIDPRTGQKVVGLPLGACGVDGSGGVFYADPFLFFASGLVKNLNSFTLGRIGFGKSAEAKLEIWLASRFGQNTMVTDLSGEYTKLAGAIKDSKILRFGKDADIFLNPLDPSMDEDTKKRLVSSLALIAMPGDRSSLTPIEDSVLMEAIMETIRSSGSCVPTLPMLVEKLAEPTRRMAQELRQSKGQIKDAAYNLFLALRRLTDTDLRGMFHKETTPGLFDATPLLVLNCEGVSQSREKAVMTVVVINFLTTGMVGTGEHQKFHRIYHDESWKLSEHTEFVSSVREAWKLGRRAGVANRLIMHHEQNLLRSSDNAVIEDLVSDTSVFVCFNQNRAEIEKSAGLIGFNPAEVDLVTKLPEHTALWKIGDLPGIPAQHIVTDNLVQVIETNAVQKTELVNA